MTRPKHYDHLLKKPLRDHLNGLLNRVDLLTDDLTKQQIVDCVMFVLIEVSRIDQIRRAAL